jgi:hypothetical protein
MRDMPMLLIFRCTDLLQVILLINVLESLIA